MPDNNRFRDGKGSGKRGFYEDRPGVKRPNKDKSFAQDRPPRREFSDKNRPPRVGGRQDRFIPPSVHDASHGESSVDARPAYPFKPAPQRGDARPVYPPRPAPQRGDARPAYPPRPMPQRGDARPAYPPRPMPQRGDDRPAYPFKPASPATPIAAPERESAPDPNALPENLLVGRNPIREALKANQTFEKLLVQRGELSGSAREIVAMAQEKNILIQHVDRSRLDQIYMGHQGMLAFMAAAEYATVEDILAFAKEKNEDAFIVLLDGITDPHNLGAIIRSCECMGAHGVIIPERRSVGLTPAAVKASAGAISHVKVAKVVNLSRTIESLKEAGLWITGAVMDAQPVEGARMDGPMALVIGSEGEGISALVRKNCDYLVSLNMFGQIGSLNASVAAGILLYEIAKARHAS